MKAAVFHGPERGLVVQEWPKPVPEPGQVLVRVAACGICHTDLHYLDHGVPTAKPPPLVLGHEASGTIAGLGAGPKGWQEGDRVLLPAVFTCGECPRCREGRENICERMQMLGNHIDGAYAEYVVAPARELIRLPTEVELAAACVIADALSTPYHAVVQRGQVRPGQVVAVFGCGGVGVNVVQFAAAAGAKVIAVDLRAAALERALSLGASAAVDASSGAPEKQVRALSSGGVDIAFEVVGRPESLNSALASVRRGGRVVVVGYCAEKVALAASRIMFFELELVGSLGCRPSDYPRIVELVRTKRIQLESVVTARLPLNEIQRGFDLLRRGEGLRTIVLP
jgi:6-hydroxycyclohex-1-ene-1-carbonyl-CoA dehydrogenase